MIKDEFYVLSNGVKIPKIGLGTWQSSKEDTYNACMAAIQAGYKHIDTAYVYENEDSVGRAIKDSKIKREDIFVTTKLPANIKTYDGALESFNESLKNLGLDYVDLYLIHAPWPWDNQGADYTEENIEVWKAMIKLYNQGLVRAIGVSNFHENEIESLVKATNFVPMVNQIRYFIGNTQAPLTRYCQNNKILVEAYSPLATGELVDMDILDNLAKKYNTTRAKLCIRYCIEKNTLPLPKSVHEERIIDNLDVDFAIDGADIDYLDSLYHIASTRKYRS
jgi:diketogulonate reductase-like aldo/keto reductase